MLYITMQHKTVYGIKIQALDNEVSYKKRKYFIFIEKINSIRFDMYNNI